MRTLQFIQFNPSSEFHSDYGYYPNTSEMYRVRNMDDSYEIEFEDDEGNIDTSDVDAISIFYMRNNTTLRARRYVARDNELNFGLLTITLDDDSQLFL